MFDFFKKKSEVKAEVALKAAFVAGLDAGIGMVRIAAARNAEMSLDHVADTMQQVLDGFLAVK